MKKLLFVLLVLGHSAFGQKNLPLIKASSIKVDIRDGEIFKKGGWNITPKLKPDIYATQNKNKKVTFYTDLDSISFVVIPNVQYDFVILLNNKDSALTRIIYVPSYLETLKKADKYNKDDKRTVPGFTYQASDNPNLVALKKNFKLDSIAGTGNEVSQILNLLHWMHNLVPHDGVHGNPNIMNATDMINVCKKDKRGLNCRGLAMALNECYLSLGFKSRYITCLPKDSLGIDSDCHVINMVFSKSLNKWLWIDPTHDAYVMNEKGELLSVEEVRERLINNLPLILNPDANWNRKSSTLKEEYLYNYMAKNLYRLECPVSSEYNTETREKGKVISYIQLLPLDYFKQLPDYTEKKDEKSGTTFINFKTNNPYLFWAKP
ncbi:MAG TPA: transglutaminase domain-containing protein [Bacteroidales bacterium]|nr:transglutaminase domain-containing protein [Bacteroidales bacterium]